MISIIKLSSFEKPENLVRILEKQDYYTKHLRTPQIEVDSPSSALRRRCRGSARNTPGQGRYIFPVAGTDSQPVRQLCG
jgi:hypothetical protein